MLMAIDRESVFSYYDNDVLPKKGIYGKGQVMLMLRKDPTGLNIMSTRISSVTRSMIQCSTEKQISLNFGKF